MKGHQKVLQLNSNLSKLVDSLCFQLAVNHPDDNSLSLLQIIEWRNNQQINHDEFKQLYCNWLESKNIYDLFTATQVDTYPKQQLLEFQGPVKNILNPKEITKILETLNTAYNEIYIEKRVKAISSNNPKNQVKNVEEVEQFFSFLDTQGVIHLRINQMFFLTAAIMISQGKVIPSDFYLFKQPFRKTLLQFAQINGCVSLRSFKNYFLVQKSKPLLVKTLNSILIQIQNFASSVSESSARSIGVPNVFRESFQKWKSYPRFKGKEKRIQFIKRLFQQNQRLLLLNDQLESSTIEQELRNKYGDDFIDCLEIDSLLLQEFNLILNDTLNKYINLFQKIFSTLNKGKSQKTQYINSTDLGRQFGNSTNKKKLQNSVIESATKQTKNSFKDKTPLKKKKNNHQFTASNNYTSSHNYSNRTPTHKNKSEIHPPHNQFASAEKHINQSGFGKTVRQTTPTKSTLSFLTEGPKTYRAAQKRGLNQNNIYDKLFFFRNKRVESYEIVMKRLKNK